MDAPLRLRHFHSSEGTPDVTLTLNRPTTEEEATRLALEIDKVLEREAVNLICDCGKRMGEHPTQPPWWPCMQASHPDSTGDK